MDENHGIDIAEAMRIHPLSQRPHVLIVLYAARPAELLKELL